MFTRGCSRWQCSPCRRSTSACCLCTRSSSKAVYSRTVLRTKPLSACNNLQLPHQGTCTCMTIVLLSKPAAWLSQNFTVQQKQCVDISGNMWCFCIQADQAAVSHTMAWGAAVTMQTDWLSMLQQSLTEVVVWVVAGAGVGNLHNDRNASVPADTITVHVLTYSSSRRSRPLHFSMARQRLCLSQHTCQLQACQRLFDKYGSMLCSL
jgi:hypothetical protein